MRKTSLAHASQEEKSNLSVLKRISRPPVSDESDSNLVTGHRWAWYALSFFIPFCGILVGLFLYDQDSREVRQVGRNCLLTGFLVWVVFPLTIAIAVVLVMVLTAISFLGQAFQPN
jgi:hypothetical protein